LSFRFYCGSDFLDFGQQLCLFFFDEQFRVPLVFEQLRGEEHQIFIVAARGLGLFATQLLLFLVLADAVPPGLHHLVFILARRYLCGQVASLQLSLDICEDETVVDLLIEVFAVLAPHMLLEVVQLLDEALIFLGNEFPGELRCFRLPQKLLFTGEYPFEDQEAEMEIFGLDSG